METFSCRKIILQSQEGDGTTKRDTSRLCKRIPSRTVRGEILVRIGVETHRQSLLLPLLKLSLFSTTNLKDTVICKGLIDVIRLF